MRTRARKQRAMARTARQVGGVPGISKLPVVVNARRCAYGGHYGASRNAFFAADTRQGGFGRGWLHGRSLDERGG